ncbi:hypothetical protein LX36DRAFT_663324, partial [Colletotrichum falcatum]
MDSYSVVIAQPTARQGVKVQCGGPDAFTLFMDSGKLQTGFFLDVCEGKNLSSAITVRAISNFNTTEHQELTFTDGSACTQGSGGTFDCAGGATIGAASGTITMTTGTGGDAAIKVTCNAGSSVFFTAAGTTGDFTKPSICGDGITSAMSVKSRVSINNP